LLNYLAKLKPTELDEFVVETYLVMLAPLAPHITEEFWRALGHENSIHLESWPKFDPEMTKEETFTVVVQINGKVRDRLQVAAGTPEAEVIGDGARERCGEASSRWQGAEEDHLRSGKLVSIVV